MREPARCRRLLCVSAHCAAITPSYAYDDLGRRISLSRGNTTGTSYVYDAVSRLASLTNDFPGASGDLTLGFGYDPASGIVSNTRSNDAYSFVSHANQNVTDTVNGLNQVTANGATSISHDARGNVSAIGGTGYAYTAENRMTSGNGTPLLYDPAGRLMLVYAATGEQRLDMLGHTLITELDSSHVIQRRYVHGPGVDEPLVWYEGSGTSDRRWLHADERGSIVAVSDGTGSVSDINQYDEYGRPELPLGGRFGYTGQVWLPELGLYYYRARIYNPALGRFMQTDPIGYGGGMNLYAYVGGDPVNFADPTGNAGEQCPGTLTNGCSEGRKELVKYLQSLGYHTGGADAATLLGMADHAIGQATLKTFAQTNERLGAMVAGHQEGFGSIDALSHLGSPGSRGETPFAIAARIANEELQRTARIVSNLGPDAGGNDIYDAERHARWTYRMAGEIGVSSARYFSSIYEFKGIFGDGQPVRNSRMDLHNNGIGIREFVAGRSIPNINTPGLMVIEPGSNIYITR